MQPEPAALEPVLGDVVAEVANPRAEPVAPAVAGPISERSHRGEMGITYYRYYVSGEAKRINSKGQVTIPTPLREKHGLREGDEVNVIEEGRSYRSSRSTRARLAGNGS